MNALFFNELTVLNVLPIPDRFILIAKFASLLNPFSLSDIVESIPVVLI